MLSITHCNIDRRAIEKATKQRKALGTKVTLVDPSGLRLAINAQSASWTYNYRQRGIDYYGKRHPQKTIKIVDPVTMNFVPFAGHWGTLPQSVKGAPNGTTSTQLYRRL